MARLDNIKKILETSNLTKGQIDFILNEIEEIKKKNDKG